MVSTGVTLRWLGLYTLICLGLLRLSRKIALRPRVAAVSRGFREAAGILDVIGETQCSKSFLTRKVRCNVARIWGCR